MTSNFRLKNVYSLPTPLGLLLLFLVGFAMWFSISHDSSTERLLFILILIIFVIHLLEASYPFRMTEIKALIAEPLFCLEDTSLKFEIKNTSNVRFEPCLIKLRKDKKWVKIDPVESHSSQIATLKFTFHNPGIHTAPSIQIKTFADSGLHYFWRNIDPPQKIAVLPRPIDHGIQANQEEINSENEELNNLEEIHDPSRFKFTDHKLFKKTNRRYQRVFRSKQASSRIVYNWDKLENLSQKQKGEQFSFWLNSMAGIKGKRNIGINVQAPFIKLNTQAHSIDLKSIKLSFAKWLYGQA